MSYDINEACSKMLMTVLHLEIQHWLWVKFGWQGRTTGKDDREVGAQEGGPPRGSTDQVVPGGSHLGIGNFSGPACLQ